MKILSTFVGLVAALVLTACGGGGDAPHVQYPALPLEEPVYASQAPIVDLDGNLHIGADVAPTDGRLPTVAKHGDTEVHYGQLQDGVGAAQIIAYLEADSGVDMSVDGEDPMGEQVLPVLIRFGSVAPTVRVAEGTPAELLDETVRAVQLINSALPRHWQLEFSPEPGPAATSEVSNGEILVQFAAQEDWPPLDLPPVDEEIYIGLAQPVYRIVGGTDPDSPLGIEIVAGQVWVDSTRTSGNERLGVIAHELIHLLGRNHVDPVLFPGTIMAASGGSGPAEHVLYPLDREALLVVYDRFEPGAAAGDIPVALGEWSDTSLHVRAAHGVAGGEISYGAALRNGLSQPWAFGPTPHSTPEANLPQSGSVAWSGRLLGLTPEAEVVAGAADMTIELATRSGRIDFTGLESWAAHAAPGAIGIGSLWQDGDLGYTVELRGNTFVQNGGDAGTVTGAFFGTSHEGMGGVLVRDDLSAGFGGSR